MHLHEFADQTLSDDRLGQAEGLWSKNGFGNSYRGSRGPQDVGVLEDVARILHRPLSIGSHLSSTHRRRVRNRANQFPPS